MIELTESSNVFLCGPVRSGKTFQLEQWLKGLNRYVRFDYTGETRKLRDQSIEHVHTPRELADRLEKNSYYFRIAYHPGKNVMEHYRWCQRAIWMLDTPRWIVVDEFHRVCPQRTVIDEDVEAALRLARHNLLGIMGASQRPQDVAKLFIDACLMCVIFKSQEENYLNACRGHWGDDVGEAVENLRPLVYRDTTGRVEQLQQCVIVTRDGQEPRVYDYATETSITVSQFLEGVQHPAKPTEIPDDYADEPESLCTDMDEKGPRDGGIPHDAGIPDE